MVWTAKLHVKRTFCYTPLVPKPDPLYTKYYVSDQSFVCEQSNEKILQPAPGHHKDRSSSSLAS